MQFPLKAAKRAPGNVLPAQRREEDARATWRRRAATCSGNNFSTVSRNRWHTPVNCKTDNAINMLNAFLCDKREARLWTKCAEYPAS